MDEGPDASAGVAEPTESEIARLAAERARLEAELGDPRAPVTAVRSRRAGRPRRIATAILAVLTALVVTVAVAGVWARRYALNTDRWVGTVGPVIEDPAVQSALGSWMTTELMGAVDPEAFFESVLPERGQVLAAPLTSALRGFVNDEVDDFVASDAFERLWVGVNRLAHSQAVALLEGETDGNLQVEGDSVVLNLVPVLNRVLAEIGNESPQIFGRTVDLPTITVDEAPADAVAKLEDALGRDIPDDFGQFRVFEASRLRQVQDLVHLFNRFVVVSVVAAVVLIGLTLWLAPRRRRTLLQLMVGIALGVVVVRRLGLRLEDDVVELVRPENRDAVQVVVGAFVSTLLDATAWVLGIAAVVAALAVVTGPYRWAGALRHGTASLARTSAAAVSGVVTRRPDESTVAWVGAHKDGLQVGGIAVGILLLLLVDLSWLGLLLLALAVGAFELVVGRIGQLEPPSEPPPGDPAVEAR
jgi:hypothetical protein